MADVAPPPLQERLDYWGPGTTTVAYPVASSSPSPPDLSYSSSSSSTSPFSPFSATFSPTSPFSSSFDPYASYAPFSPTTPSATSAVTMTDIMSYQYPPPPPNVGSVAHMALSPAGYHMPMAAADYANGIPQTSSSSGLGQDPHSSPRERRDSLSKSSNVNMKLKRSLSTPVVAPQQSNANMSMSQQQGLSQPDHAALSLAAEKRRNKLGYHRTSVACGHCRRRKIRCIPSPADIQGRCVNCIRLKKECSFYPVDQQPPPDTRKNSTSRSSVGHHNHHLSSAAAASAASASASAPIMPAPAQLPLPSLATLPDPDPRGRPQQNTQPLTMPSIQTMAPPSMKPSGGEPFSPDPKRRQSFDYSHSGMTNWMSADASPSSSKPGDLNASWRSYPQESPITPAFSPYTTHAAPPSATWTPQSEAAGRGSDDLGWSYPPPPPRSLSFGSDTMSSHHSQHQQQAYPSISQMTSGHHHHSNNSSSGGGGRSSSSSYDRKSSAAAAAAMSDLYQSPTTIPGADSIPGTTLDHHVSLTAGAVGTTAYSSWQQPYSYSKDGSDAYVGWGDHGTTPASEGHATSSMYYTGR